MASLIDGAGDFRLRSADEALGVLFPQPEQISLDDERASFIAFCAILAKIHSTHRLFARVRLSLRAGPALRTIARLKLDAEQERLLANLEAGFGVRIDLETGDHPRTIDQGGQNDGMPRN